MDNLQTKIEVLETKIQAKQAWIDQKILEIREESGIDALEKELRALRAEIKQGAQNDAKAEAEQLLADATAGKLGEGELYLYKATFLGITETKFVRLVPAPGKHHLEMRQRVLHLDYNKCPVLSHEFINHQERMNLSTYGSNKKLIVKKSIITNDEKCDFLKELLGTKTLSVQKAWNIAIEHAINPFEFQRQYRTMVVGSMWDAVCISSEDDKLAFVMLDERGELRGIINDLKQFSLDPNEEETYQKATPEELMWLENWVGEFDHYFED